MTDHEQLVQLLRKLSVRTGTFDGCSAPQGSFTTHYGILRAGGSLRPSQLFGRSGLTQRAVPAVINFGLSTYCACVTKKLKFLKEKYTRC